MYRQISAGLQVPNDCNVIIEIPAHSEPVKYEVDKNSGALMVDRFMAGTMRYPCDYGYIPKTLSEDGDPVDVLVVSPYPLLSGSIIRVRPIGLLRMTDEAGRDAKILAVPIHSLTKIYKNIATSQDLYPLLLEQITHFFEHYKDLEEGKWVKVEGWEGPEAAKAEITAGVARFQNDTVNEYIMVFCTCPDMETAKNIAEQIVTQKLAACVNLVPNLTSLYTWENKLETSSEVLLMIKTTRTAYATLEKCITKVHPYDCPEIIALSIEQGLEGYLQWIKNSIETN